MSSIVLTEKFNVSNAKRLIFCNKIKPEDRTYLINKVKKFPDGNIQVNYKTDKSGFGRFKTSIDDKKFIAHYMIGTPKYIRSFLAKDLYHDLDIENCHPVLITQIAKKHDIEVPSIDDYVNNRNSIIDNICSKCNTNRELVKNCIIRILYGGSPNVWAEENNIDEEVLPDFLYKFKRDVKKIIDKVLKNNDNFVEWVKKKNDKESLHSQAHASDHSVFAHYIQTEERKCLEAMYNFMKSNNHIVGALIHDGLMIERLSNGIDNELLEKCSEYVFNETGYKVKIVEKDMIQDESLIEGDVESYDYMKYQFETNHLKILYPALYIKESDKPFLMTSKQLLDTYSHINYTEFKDDGKMTKKNFVSTWIKDDNIRKYDKMDFLPPPLIADNNTYNQWMGFAASNLTTSSEDFSNEIKEILDVFKALCGDDDNNWAYFEKWIAQMIQQPGKITGISILLKSIEGCGKGFICEVLKKIMGDEYYYQSGNAENDVFNRFSNALRFRILININESKAKTNYDYQDLIKHIITAPTITYEEKGKQSIVIKNCARLLFTTNNDFAMPISDDERRFVIYECSSKYKGKSETWNKLFNYIENPNIIKALYNHFMSINIDNVDWINDRPKTEAYNELVSYNTPKELRFLVHIAKTNYRQGNNTIKKSTTILFKEFREWLDNSGMKDYITNVQKFGLQLNKYKELFDKHKSHGIMVMQLDCKKILDFGTQKHVITEEEIPSFGVPYPFIDEDVDTNILDD